MGLSKGAIFSEGLKKGAEKFQSFMMYCGFLKNESVSP